MAFGQRNAPATFQGEMGVTFAIVKWQHTLFYEDDNTVFSPTAGEYIKRVESVLRLVYELDEL